MTLTVYYSLLALALAGIGLWGLLAHGHLLRRILAFNVMCNGVFLLLVAGAYDKPPDPVPHALVLTGIVIGVSATAFALALVRRLHRDSGRTRLTEDGPALPGTVGEKEGR